MKVLKILLGLAVIAALFLGGIYYFTSGLTDSADEFFAQVRSGHIQKAHDNLSQGFKNNTSLPGLQKFLENSALESVQETSWTSRSRKNNTGKLEGSVTTTDGAVIPLTIDLVKEADQWRILGISTPNVGLKDSAPALVSTRSIPANDQLVQLTAKTTAAFGTAVDTKDMSHLHRYISKLWQDQFTVEQLEKAYSSLYKLGAKWSSLQNLSPIFDKEPEMNSDGVLIISGYYPTKPDLLTFQHKYITEGTKWKLLGLSVKLVKPDSGMPLKEEK